MKGNTKGAKSRTAMAEEKQAVGRNLSLTPEEFEVLVNPLEADPRRCAAAVSGGPDSMALAWLLKTWAESRGGKAAAFIVDHRLRPESTEEAKEVKRRLEEIGMESEILTWEHGPVTARIHVEARKARYDLLFAACKRRGARDLFLAHQIEDQAETVLMRLAKGSGVEGLAGMAPVTTAGEVRLLRPLLTVAKERLAATCREAGIAYVSDPSNDSSRYARSRLRRVMPLLAGEGLTVERLADLAERAREAREALDHAARALLRVAVKTDLYGVLRFDLEHLRSAPRAVALKALAACLQSVHMDNFAPKRAKLLPLYEGLCSDAPMDPRTLHGCFISKGAGEACIMREYSAVSDSKPVFPGESVVWDGRWLVELAPELPPELKRAGLTVRALGFQTRELINRLAPGLRKKAAKGRARAALPALWRGEELAAIPDFDGYGKAPIRARVDNTPEKAV